LPPLINITGDASRPADIRLKAPKLYDVPNTFDVHAELVHLDVLRGVAALAVFLGHLRTFVFVPYSDLSSQNPINAAVWIISGFGHQAVMVFFVLSGFFITKSALQDDAKHRFSWQTFLIKRLSRLWVVLIPSLLLTAFWDQIGRHYSTSGFYEGKLYSLYNSMPSGGESLDAGTFFGNVLFLQTIKTPIFGSNGPVWSLANEWWYYILFLLVFMIIRDRHGNVAVQLARLLSLALVCAFIGYYIAIPGGIWFLGALSFIVVDRNYCKGILRSTWVRVFAFVALGLALGFSKTSLGAETAKDYAVGIGATLVVLVLATMQGGGALYARLSKLVADSSYTLYLAHFPFIAVVVNVVLLNRKFDATPEGYAVFALIGVVTLTYCYGVYWLFERHTGAVRRHFLNKLISPRVAVR
jgi:peptidoglycan/LPS O-acetylase OafA/YrhL